MAKSRNPAIARAARLTQRATRWWPAVMCTATGDVTPGLSPAVPGKPGWIYVAMPGVAKVFNGRVAAATGKRVIVGYEPHNPTLLRVLDFNSSYLGGPGGGVDIGAHHGTHEAPGGSDIVYSQARQLMPLRVSVVSGLVVKVERSPVWTVAGWALSDPATLDLSADVPLAGFRYALIFLDAAGNLSKRAGAAVPGLIPPLGYGDIPAWAAGETPLAAVRLYAGQTTIAETDVVDLRFAGAPLSGGGVAADPIWQTLGDLVVGIGPSAAGILAAGADGQMLSANSAEPTGLEWVTAGADVTLAGETYLTILGQLITAHKVTLAQLANIATARLLGRTTAGSGVIEELTAATVLALLGLTGSSGTNTGDVTLAGENYLTLAGQLITAGAVNLSGTHVTGVLAAGRFPALTGDVTSVAGALATAIAAHAVTLAKMATMATASFLGRNTAGVGDVEVLSVATVKALLSLAGSNSGDVTLAGETYISLVGQVITAARVTLAQLADMATASFLGRNTAGAGVTEVLSVATVKTMLGLTGSNSGDVTLAGETYIAIAGQVITAAKPTLAQLVNIATARLLGRNTAGAGVIEELTAATVLTMLGLTGSSGANSGDVTLAGETYLAIAGQVITAAKITLAQQANVATASFLGRTTAGAGVIEVLTAAQATAMLNVMAAGLKGLAPAPGAVPAATNFLTETGAWAVPAGSHVAVTLAGETYLSLAGQLITAHKVTLTQLANIATARILGRTTAGAGVIEELTGTQLTAMLDVMAAGLKGLAPAPSGAPSALKYLTETGAWAVPASVVNGSGANTRVAYWTAADTLAGDAGLVYDPVTDTLTIAGNVMPAADAAKDLGSGTFRFNVAYINGLLLGTATGVSAGGLSMSGLIQKYNNVATVGAGIPSIVALVDSTGLGAAVATTTLYAVPAAGAGLYRVNWYAKVTTPGGTSSNLGPLTVGWTDATDSVAQTVSPVDQSNQTNTVINTTVAKLAGVALVWAKASTNITYAMAYASVAAGVMKYELHIKVEFLG